MTFARVLPFLLVAPVLGACREPAPDEKSSPTAATSAKATAATPAKTSEVNPLGEGFLMWESNRTGVFRIWTERLDRTGLRQISPDEDGRHHAAPHISPDGRRVAYLSVDGPWDRYPNETIGTLHLIASDGSGDRVLAARARTYFEDRAVTWLDDATLAFIDGDGHTQRLDLASGVTQRLTHEPSPERPWLPDPTLRWMTSGETTFSPFDVRSGVVSRQRLLGGCQPWFSSDGVWGFWANGAGGPISRMHLETRAISTVLRKHDSRLPKDLGYVYFPMLSRDQTLLALAGSNDLHDHFRYDYEILVAAVDPATLEVLGDFVRMTEHPAIDRFPDVWVAPGSRIRPRPALVPTPEPAPAAPGWPVARTNLVFLWDTADAANLVREPGNATPLTYALDEQRLTTLDHSFALVLHGGLRFVGGTPTITLANAFKRTNEITIEATIQPAVARTLEPARILGMSSGLSSRNFTLGQVGDRLFLKLRTSDTPVDGADVILGRIPGEGPHHVVVSYSPGELRAWIDGEPTLTSDAVQGDFFHWAPRVLVIGAEATGELAWHGTIRGIALYDRAFSDAAARTSSQRYRATLDQRAPVASLDVTLRLRSASTFPTVKDISPYRRALSVLEWDVVEVHRGSLEPKRLRVAHWSMIDAIPLAITEFQPGALRRLHLERFDDNPQVASDYLSDTLELGADPLWLDVGEVK